MMKKIILHVMLLVIPGLSFAQSTENNVPAVKTDYLNKSKKQKTAAWILLASGFALSTTSVLLATPKAEEDYRYYAGIFYVEPDPQNDYSIESVLLVSGIVSMLGSIPLFVASGKNKKKTMNITTNIKMEKATIFERQAFVQSSYPAIAFKINL